ncbi:MAG: amidohydrolase family protein [Rhodothermales bacterium]|nr:amidohydrolase family protein [Rhodothermales bacterium]
MKTTCHFVASFLLWFAAVASSSCTNSQTSNSAQGVIAIERVSVIPMNSERVLGSQTVIVRNGRIDKIGSDKSVDIPDDALRIDGTGKYLIPGLSDMHAHARRTEGYRPEDYLHQGVTVVRNMQGISAHITYRDNALENGAVFRTAGQALAGYKISDNHRIITDPQEGRVAVREQVAAGYDYIKVYSFLTLDVYNAILDEAKMLGIPVVGHVSDNVRSLHAIASGQSSFEHLYGYFWDLEAEASAIKDQWVPRRLFHAVEIDDHKLEGIARKTAAAGVWNCPTLWRKDNHLTSPLAREAWNDPELRELGHSNRMKLVKALHEAGAGLLSGTDDKAHRIHDELALFVEAGLTPYETLKIATVNAAVYLDMENEIGTIEIGKRANLVLLAANPLDNIENTRTIVGVMAGGNWLPSSE